MLSLHLINDYEYVYLLELVHKNCSSSPFYHCFSKKITISSKIMFNLQATEDGAGSPVDVARSYMRSRLPWGSPAANNSEFRSPLQAGKQFLNEGTPFPYSAGNLSSSKVHQKAFQYIMQCSAYFSYGQMFFVHVPKEKLHTSVYFLEAL